MAVADDESPVASGVRSLLGEYQAARESYVSALSAAETAAAKRQAETRRPKPAEYARRFLNLAKSNPADPAAFDALAWIITYNARSHQAEEAMDLLARNQVRDKRLGTVLQNLGDPRSHAPEKVLRAALESSPHREVRAQACYSLAGVLLAGGREAAAASGGRAKET